MDGRAGPKVCGRGLSEGAAESGWGWRGGRNLMDCMARKIEHGRVSLERWRGLEVSVRRLGLEIRTGGGEAVGSKDLVE